jgi:hypothetical protein
VLLQARGCVPLKRGECNEALCDRLYIFGDEGEALGDDRDGNRHDEKSRNVREMYFCLIRAMNWLTTAHDQPSCNQTCVKQCFGADSCFANALKFGTIWSSHNLRNVILVVRKYRQMTERIWTIKL